MDNIEKKQMRMRREKYQQKEIAADQIVEMREAEIMTVPMLARYLRCHPSTVYRLLKQRKIPGFKLGSDWRFNKSSVQQWIKNRSIKLT